MSKLVVDSLPYYGGPCPLEQLDLGCDNYFDAEKYQEDPDACPKYWNKYFVCSDDNPRECERLIELKKALQHMDD